MTIKNIRHMKTQTDSTFTAYIGLDWGDSKHAVALYPNSKTAKIETTTIDNTPEAMHTWLKCLAQRFSGKPIALGVETSRGPLINLFMPYPWLTVFPIHPATSARYRKAFTPSGAKDDQPDAIVMLELVRDHQDKLRPLAMQDSDTRKLAALVELRRDTIDRRTQVMLQLESLLKSYFPQALDLVGSKIHSDLALDFLTRWPDPIALKKAKPSTIRSFYYKHFVRSDDLVKERLEQISKLSFLTTDDSVLEPALNSLRLLLDQLRLFKKHITLIEQKITTLFNEHSEAYLYRNLPGAGKALQPRLLVAFGTDRTLFPDPACFQKYAGIAPVVERSGKQCWIHWRWHAPLFLRQTLIEWSGQTVVYSVWAKDYYKKMENMGKSRHVILRALAFKWIRILWKCWQTRTPYNEEQYLKQLHARKSPYAV